MFVLHKFKMAEVAAILKILLFSKMAYSVNPHVILWVLGVNELISDVYIHVIV